MIHDYFYSPSLDAFRQFDIYVPEAYLTDENAYFPVVYYLHGFGGNHHSHHVVIHALADLIDAGTVEPMIIVKPDGSTEPLEYWNPVTTMFANSGIWGNHEDAIANDLIEYVDLNYRTLSNVWHRALIGFSMGGESAMRIALTHPDKFCAVASHSSPMDYNYILTTFDTMVEEIGGNPPYFFEPTTGPYTRMNYTRAAAYSENLENFPFQVDFILNPNGSLNTAVWSKWMEYNPMSLIWSMEYPYIPKIYFDIGEEEDLGFYPFNISFADSLDEMGFEYVFETFPGLHHDDLQERIPVSIAFMDSIFQLYNEYYAPGDINFDHNVNVLDVVMLLNAILSGNEDYLIDSDFNNDDGVDILDIVFLVTVILNS